MKVFLRIFKELKNANQPINSNIIEWWLDIKIAQRNKKRALGLPVINY